MDIFLASLGVFLGELYGNFIGGGSIMTQFFLQNIIGLGIKESIALDNSSVIGSEIGLLFMLLKKYKIKKWMFWLIISGIFGSLIGAYLLNIIPVNFLKIIFTIILFSIVLYSFFQKKEKKEKGFKITNKNIFLLSISIFFIGIYNSFLSIGDFIIGILVLTLFFNFKYKKALFLITFVSLFIRFTGLTQYLKYNLIDLNYLIPMFFSALISGLISGYLVQKIETEKLEIIIKFLGLFLAIYLGYSFL